MKRLILALFVVVIGITISAQNIKGKYASRATDDGALFFIFPQKGFTCEPIKSSFEYDVTLLTARDSLTYNFTFFNAKAQVLDSVVFINKEINCMSLTEMLFVEPYKKNQWKHRVSVKISKKDFEKLYNQAESYKIELYAGENKYIFGLSPKEWKKQADIINKILTVVKFNQ